MNKLTPAQRAKVLQLLCEGMSIRAIERVTDVSKNTVIRLLNTAGAVCAAYQDKAFVNLPCKQVQVDEVWSFVYSKQKNVKGAKAAPDFAGDAWTWTAIDADTKLVFSVLVGGRTFDYAAEFLADVKERLANRVQLTSDGHHVYLQAVRDAFKKEIDFAQLVKMYGSPSGATATSSGGSGGGRYSPGALKGIKKSRVTGHPDMAKVSTSFVERQNLTMRMHMRRFTRLTNAFSKKVENHVNAISLHFFYYNFIRQHASLKGSTPAMAAGVSKVIWTMADLVALIEENEPKPGKRGPYKKRP